MENLQKLLPQVKNTGIYHLPHNGQTELNQAAGELGFARYRVNLDESGDLDAILGAFGRDLDFPDWYGANFDALNDCLTDFSWREAAGYVITIAGADTLHADSETFARLNEVLSNAIEEWQARNIPFWIFYDLRANGLATLPLPE